MIRKLLFILFVITIIVTGAYAGELSDVFAYPVPFRPSAGHATIMFSNLSSVCTIRVFTMSGKLIQTLSESDGDGLYSWDVLNADGSDLASGVYLYHVKSSSDSKIGRIIVNR